MASLIFDLDGTLVDSAELLKDVGNTILDELELPRLSVEESRRYIGNGARAYLERALRARHYHADKSFPDLLSQFMTLYTEAPGSRNKSMPFVIETLKKLARDGHSLALCTNKPTAPTQVLLKALDWVETFQAVICGDTLEHRKPHPAPLLEARRKLPVAATIYIGDSEVDAAAAGAADIPFILFTQGYRSKSIEELQPLATFDDFRELPALVNSLLPETGAAS